MVLTSDENKVWRLILGDRETITSFYYARQGDSNTILLMEVTEEVDIRGLTYRLRDHRLFQEPLQGMHKISYREAGSVITLELERPASPAKILPIFGAAQPLTRVVRSASQAPAWSVTDPYYFPADEKTIVQLLRELSQWEVKAFVEESVGARTNLAKYGLNDPHAGLVIHQAGRRFPLKIIFGRPSGSAGPVFLKTSQVSKIFEIAPVDLEAVQMLLNNASSRKQLFFLSEIGSVEILTSQRRINVWREKRQWRASSVDLVSRAKAIQSRRSDEPLPVYFKGADIISKLKALEYLDTLSENNPFFNAYRQSTEVMKIRFVRPSGNLREVFQIYKSGDNQNVWFLKRQSDETIYLIQRQAVGALLRTLKPSK